MTLRVILQIVPLGEESRTYEIGRLDVFNKGPIRKAYRYGVIDLTPGQEGMFGDEIVHFRDEGAWELVRAVLDHLHVVGPV